MLPARTRPTLPRPTPHLADRTARASSADPGDGSRPGATQAGHKLASFQFDPRPPAPGLISRPEDAVPTPALETAPALPKPNRSSPRPDATPPTYAATPAPTATPAATTDPNEFAAAFATPPPPPEDPFDPTFRSTSPPLPKAAGKNSPAGSSRSAENGKSANRGPGSVDTLATPTSRYGRQVTDMIKYTWSRAVDRRDEMAYGITVVHCKIDKDGHVTPRILTNTSDVLFGAIALQAVQTTQLPAMPPDVAADTQGSFALDITFDLTPLPQEAAVRR